MTGLSENYTETYLKHLSNEQLFRIFDAIPMGINVWTSERKLIYTNQYLVDLFACKDKEVLTETFFKFSPEFQPDGARSMDLAGINLDSAYEKGFLQFNWMHITNDGDEIPCEITMHVINTQLITLIRDLRPQLADYESAQFADGFFYNRITDKALFNAAAELSDEWFWAYEMKTAEMQFFGNGIKILDLPTDKNPFPSGVVDSGIVHPDDLEEFLRFDAEMKKGNPGPFDIRFYLPDKSFRHYRIIYNITKDKQGNPLYAIGKTFDIHEQKMLEKRSKTDLLTDCLNKISTENAVEEIIAKDGGLYHALFIVDVDNFKAVNDNLGHQFGDRVLKEIADKLQMNFREEDIIGRIGGDEFIVFVQNLSDADTVIRKAEAVSKAFKNSYSGENGDYKISGSIGVAMFPKDGASYNELYNAADKALYQSKRKGKDCYTFYSEEFADSGKKALTLLENANRLENTYFDPEMISGLFDTLYESSDLSKSLDMVMRYIGRRLNVDRCYIIEADGEGESYSVTHEWCSRGIEAQIDIFQDIPIAELQVFYDAIAVEGVLYSNDVELFEKDDAYQHMRGQGIKSFLLIQEKGRANTHTVMGLDDCTRSREWSEREIISLRYALKIISIFLLNN